MTQLQSCRDVGPWQPITSAPKDGTPVLLFGPDTTDPQIWIANWCVFEGDAPGEGSWTDYGERPVEITGPTHWMPLPEPPHE